MRVLVLGGGGMLGHKMFQTLSERFPDTWCTLRERRAVEPWSRVELFRGDRVLDGVDAMDLDAVDGLLAELRPDAVVNCIGVIKQRGSAKEAIPSLTINSLLPHRLAAAAARHGGRVVHFSTDCVFSGRRGGYTEDDFADAEDLYGRTKYLGEVAADNALTLRTSIIGRELRTHRSLLDWFLAQRGGRVQGFRGAWWSGVTTNHLSEVVADFLVRFPALSGVWQVASQKISKYELLLRLREAYGLEVEVEPSDAGAIDRSLSGERLEAETGYRCPPWEVLLPQLANDPTPYHRWLSTDEIP
jgi:dTDP-4-dehydrorhamnose reductase